MTAPQHTVWEYATLLVDWSWHGDNEFTFHVSAYSDERELFSEIITEMYWSRPLARMGKMGWELVGLNPQNVLADANNKGYEGRSISVPIRTVFFFKRPHVPLDRPSAPRS